MRVSGDSGLRFQSLLSVSQISSLTQYVIFFKNNQHQGTGHLTKQRIMKVLK